MDIEAIQNIGDDHSEMVDQLAFENG